MASQVNLKPALSDLTWFIFASIKYSTVTTRRLLQGQPSKPQGQGRGKVGDNTGVIAMIDLLTRGWG